LFFFAVEEDEEPVSYTLFAYAKDC